MANTPNDNTPFYEYLVDDPEMIASTPLSPQFSPNIFGGAFDVRNRPHHATRARNQAMPGPGHNRPSSTNESTTAILNSSQNVTGVPGLATPQVLLLQRQQFTSFQRYHQQQPHQSALGELELTAAENQGQQHQFASAPFADHQGTPALLHVQQGHQQAPATWLPPGYGAPLYSDSQQQQQAAAAVSSSSSSTIGVSVANPPVTVSAAGDLSSSNAGGDGGQLLDFGFAAPAGEQAFLGGDYADITPLSTAAAVTAHSQPTTTFDFHSSPWRPRLQDNTSVTLTPNITAVAAAELNHDVRKQSKGSMEDDSDTREPSWGDADDDNEYQGHRRRGGGEAGVSSSTSPRPRRQQRKGKRRTLADAGAAGVNGSVEDDDEPTSPAGRTSISGRSNKSASVASTTTSSSKTAPAPRLRSASRTSKNALQKPAETAEERRTRASHNLVEKQYRNRLNAQFEGLLNALPEQVRGPASTGADGGGYESDPQPADQERRVSKAEVLDMARRHIKSLERERDELQRERGDLLRNLEIMEREMAAGGGGRLDEFLDVEGPADRSGESSWRNA